MSAIDDAFDYLKAVSAGAVGGYIVNLNNLPALSEVVAQFFGLIAFLLVYVLLSRLQQKDWQTNNRQSQKEPGKVPNTQNSEGSFSRYAALESHYDDIRD